jgi:hypothetical protein
MDFRTAPAGGTRDLLNVISTADLVNSPDSGCIPVSYGKHIQCCVELPVLMISLACLLASALALPLTWLEVLPGELTYPVLFITLAICLTQRMFSALIYRACLRMRSDNLLKLFAPLPRRFIKIEDGKTYRTTKVIVEDAGVCILDSENHRLLIEGCCYRYLLHAKDVQSVEAISGYALGGALISCQMGKQPVNIAIISSGMGPLASLIHAFAPGESAKGIASALNRTLFGIDQPNYKNIPRPPIIGASA